MKTPSATEVARLFLYWSNRDGDVITNLKMQKLLYYAQAWYLVNFGRPLFPDDIEAWDLGPVVPAIYHELKKYGASPIDYQDRSGKEEEPFTKEQLRFLSDFYATFIRVSAHDLVNMSHNEQPWKQAFKSHTVIDPKLMKEFYSQQYRKRNPTE